MQLKHQAPSGSCFQLASPIDWWYHQTFTIGTTALIICTKVLHNTVGAFHSHTKAPTVTTSVLQIWPPHTVLQSLFTEKKFQIGVWQTTMTGTGLHAKSSDDFWLELLWIRFVGLLFGRRVAALLRRCVRRWRPSIWLIVAFWQWIGVLIRRESVHVLGLRWGVQQFRAAQSGGKSWRGWWGIALEWLAYGSKVVACALFFHIVVGPLWWILDRVVDVVAAT